MNEIMNQYELLAPFQNKNAGFSRWTYAIKNGKKYFLKEFLNPVYPTDDALSDELRKQRIYDCVAYEGKKRRLYKAINNASHGNLVRIEEFFRYDNHYYIATERIIDTKIAIKAIPAVSFDNRLMICKSIAFEMMNLHRAGIVHADIKEDNILIKVTHPKGKLIGKIIDMDASFFESDPPKYEEDLVCDQVYMAPEACQFICGEPVKLTCKMDVFSLGILFHQYLTGKLPDYDLNEYDYAYEAVLDDQKLQVSAGVPFLLQEMINGMLECEPEKRMSMDTVYSILCAVDMGEKTDKHDSGTKDSEADNRTVKSEGGWFHSPGDL